MAAESGSYDEATLLRRQKIAEAMLSDAVKPRKIEHWAQGLAQMGQSALGGYLGYQANQEAKAERAASDARIEAMFGGGGAAPATAPAETSGQLLPPPVPSAPQTSFPGATEVQTGSNGQKIPIYGKSDDPVPSPLDPPSGEDRVRTIATILGESANQPAVGQNAVASVIRNRAVAGNYGGRSPSQVVTAPNQFEPWNTSEGRNKMATMTMNPELYAAADRAISRAYGEGGQAPNDPTGGAVNFIEPKLQTALGRPMPDWAQKPGIMIGDHKFIGGATSQQPYEVAGPPTAPPSQPQAPVAQAMTPPQMPAAQPSGGGGLLANATPQQRAFIIRGFQSGASPAERAIATSMMQSLNKADAPTDEMREYNLDSSQRKARGEQPLSFFDFKTGLKKAGATNVVTNVDKGENSFATEAGKSQAKRFDELASEGQQAKQMVSDIETLTELGKSIGTGKGAEAKAKFGPYAEALGIKIDGLSDIQAYEAIVNRVAPSLRVKGSGAQSDLELKNFLKSLPSLGNTPEGNALAAATIKGLQENKILAAEIASKALSGEISRPEAEKQLRNLPDPMTNYREFMKGRKEAKPVETPAQPDRAAIEAEMRKRGLLK